MSTDKSSIHRIGQLPEKKRFAFNCFLMRAALACIITMSVVGKDVQSHSTSSNAASTAIGDVPVSEIRFSPDAKTLMTSASDGRVGLWNTRDLKLRSSFNEPRLLRTPGFSSGGQSIICVLAGGTVEVRDIHTAAVRRTFRGFDEIVGMGNRTEEVLAIATSGDFLAGFKNGALLIYDIRSGKLVRSIIENIGSLHFSSDGKRLAVGDVLFYGVGSVRVWDTLTGRRVCVTSGALPGQNASLATALGRRRDARPPVLFSPDGEVFVTIGMDPDWQEQAPFSSDLGSPVSYVVKVWQCRSGKLLHVFRGKYEYSENYRPLQITKEGQLLCAGDGQLDIMELESGRRIKGGLAYDFAAISPDGREVARRIGEPQNEGFVEVRALEDEKLLGRRVPPHPWSVFAFTPDGASMVFSSYGPLTLSRWNWRSKSSEVSATRGQGR